jgi:hypothetical protein
MKSLKLALKISFIFLVLLLNTFVCFSQNLITVNGIVIDKNTNLPLSYANIGLTNSNIGTVSNKDGEFVLKVSKNNINDSVSISYIGYKTYKCKILEINHRDCHIYLVPKTYTLNEVKIKPLNPTDIILKAIDNLDKNYPGQLTKMTGFYRQNIQQDNKLTELSEIVVEIYKPYFNAKDYKIKLIEGRTKKDVSKGELGCASGNGIDNLLLYHDFVTKPSNFGVKKKFKYFNYKIEKITKIDNNYIYVISFYPKKKIKKLLPEGKLYITTDTYAFVAIESSSCKEKIKYWKPVKIADLIKYWELLKTENLILNIFTGIKQTGIVDYYSKTEYQEINNIWYLKTIISNSTYIGENTKEKQDFKLFYSANLVITDIEKVNTSALDSIKNINDYRPIKAIIGEYNEDFWDNYNIIKIEKSLKESLNK